MTPKLVIFDCDGVLVETESHTDQVLSTFFTAHGAPITPAEVHKLFAGGTMEGAGAEATLRGAILPPTWLEDVYAAMFDRLRQGVMVFDGLIDLLDALDAAGIHTAIASNGPMAKMKISLTPSGLWDRFSGRIYSREHYPPKPAPDMLLQAAKDADVAISNCIMIDDTPAGINSAKNAGMRGIGFSAASNADLLATTGFPVAHTMADVKTLLGV